MPVLAVCRGSQVLNVALRRRPRPAPPRGRRPRGPQADARRLRRPRRRRPPGDEAARDRRRARPGEEPPPPGLRPPRRGPAEARPAPTTARSRRSRTRRGASRSASSGIPRKSEDAALFRALVDEAAALPGGARVTVRPQPGHRGGDPRAARRRAAEETDAAVARAKAAFPAWRKVAPADRARLLRRAGDARRGARRGARAHRVRERRQADRRRPGRDRHGRRGLPLLRGRGRQAPRRDDPGRRRRRPDLPRAARRRRADRPLELPAQHRQLEARPGARLREHRRAEAGRADAALGAAARASSCSRPESPRAS